MKTKSIRIWWQFLSYPFDADKRKIRLFARKLSNLFPVVRWAQNRSNFYDISIRSKDVRNFSFYIFAKITLFNESFLLNSDLLKLLRYLLPFKRFFNQILNWINILYQNNNNSSARILEKTPINWHVGCKGFPFLPDCKYWYSIYLEQPTGFSSQPRLLYSIYLEQPTGFSSQPRLLKNLRTRASFPYITNTYKKQHHHFLF